MKVSVDGVEVLSLNNTQKKVIQHDISSEIFESDMKRRVNYILTHKYERCLERLKREWEPKLIAAGVKAFPTDPDEFAKLVFKQPGYKSRSQRDKESKI